MPFDSLPLVAKIFIGLLGPPTVTIICWLLSPLLTGVRHKRNPARKWIEFWLMLIAAHLVHAFAFAYGHFFNGNYQVDPSSQLVR